MKTRLFIHHPSSNPCFYTNLDRLPCYKSKFFSNSCHQPDPIGTGFKWLIRSSISWNNDFDTIAFAI